MPEPAHQPDPDTQHTLLQEIDALQSRLNELEEELEHLGRLATLGTLAGVIAHEVNNILTPVLSYAQLAQQSLDDQDLVEKALKKAVHGAESASKIADSVLGFARKESGPPLSDVRAVVYEAMSCLVREPERDGIQVDIDVPRGLLAGIGALSLHQVLMNLILNSVRAMKQGGGRLRVRARGCSTWNGAEPGESAAIDAIDVEVEDTGPGIAPDRLLHIFDAFHTRNAADGSSKKGTGLGLAVCRRLVEGAGGAISVESELGRGTRFRIHLPAAPKGVEPSTTDVR